MLNRWRGWALTVLVVSTMLVSCQRNMSRASTLRPIAAIGSLFCFYVLVEEQGEPQLVSIQHAVRANTPVALAPGQTPITTTEGLARAAEALSRRHHSYSLKTTLSNEMILLELDGKDDTLWSQYSVEAGRIIPLQAASFARRDLAYAFMRSLMLGLLVLTLTVIALAAMPILHRRASE